MQAFSDEIGFRLASLADGEGCFVISRQQKNGRTSHQCSFSVKMRADDGPFLDRWCSLTGLGRVYYAPAYPDQVRKNQPSAMWVVTRRRDCLALVDLFESFPLWSKKARDFEVWAQAVRYWNDPKTLPRSGRGNQFFVDQEPLIVLHERLRAVRAYAA